MTQIRKPAVAGHFYPANAGELRKTVLQLLARAGGRSERAPKALVVPHAGYVYSGEIAAAAYARLLPHASNYRHVVLLGPSHRFDVRALALSRATAFRSPLGDVPIRNDVVAHPRLIHAEEAHRLEHSLEVQLPFLQLTLPAFSLMPIAVGSVSAEEVADVLGQLWDGRETLVVVSTDLSHFHEYSRARVLDESTRQAVESLDAGAISRQDACGAIPLRGLLMIARKRALRVETLDLRNSGDVAGNRSEVVGYGAWALYEDEPCERAA